LNSGSPPKCGGRAGSVARPGTRGGPGNRFLASNPIEDEMGEIARSPYTIVGQSDAGAHVQFISNFGVWTTLLGHYVRARRLLSL